MTLIAAEMGGGLVATVACILVLSNGKEPQTYRLKPFEDSSSGRGL